MNGYYIRGNADGKSVIAKLQACGGVNNEDCYGNNTNTFYYFTYVDKTIRVHCSEDFLNKIGCRKLEINSKVEEHRPNKTYYIRGNCERGRDVIAKLEEVGGYNRDLLRGNGNSVIYYFNTNPLSKYNNVIMMIDDDMFNGGGPDCQELFLDKKTDGTKIIYMLGNKLYGRSVIHMLEMMGGINSFNCRGTESDAVYYIDPVSRIIHAATYHEENWKYHQKIELKWPSEDVIEKEPSPFEDVIDPADKQEENFNHYDKVIILTKANKWKLDWYSHKDKNGNHVCISYQRPKKVLLYTKENLKYLD